MFDDVLQAFLRDAVQRDFDVLGQPDVGQFKLHVQVRYRPGQAGQPARQAQIIENRRAQSADRRTRFAQRQPDQFACLAELTGRFGGIIADSPRRRVEPIGQGDQALRDAVVNIAGYPTALDFLGLDHLLDEQLVCPLSGYQLPVQPGLVHGPGDEPADDPQEFDVTLGELAACDRVHVEYADQSARVGFHRHGHHRGEVTSAQRLDRQVAGVGFLVVGDDDGLAVLGHPAGNAGSQRQANLSHLPVERRCRTGEGQRAVGVVEHMHETHVGPGGRGDHPRCRGRQRLHPGAARGSLDEFPQQRQFTVGVNKIAYRVRAAGAVVRCCRLPSGHW